MSFKLGKLLGQLAPLAGFIPGIGIPLATAIGAGGGLLSGGGLRGALTGALAGGLTGGGANFLGQAAGLTGTGLSTATGALTGAGLGLNGGGTKGALLGGLTGGVGGYLNGSGVLGSALGTAAHTLPAGVSGPVNAGSGLLGSLGSLGTSLSTGASALKNAVGGIGSGGGFGGGSSSFAPSLISGALGAYSNSSAQDAVNKQLKLNQQALNPIINAQFTPGDLTKDPGYQFQLGQGNQALDRQQLAKGNYFSGESLKAAQDYGQGLADQTYNNAFQRFQTDQNRKLTGALAGNGIREQIGTNNANAITSLGNLGSQVGASLFGGNGISNTGQIMNQNQYGGSTMSPQVIQNLMSTPEGLQYLRSIGRA